MSIETDLRTYLAAQASFTATLGTSSKYTTHLFCAVIPQDAALPACTISNVTANHEHTLLAGAGFCWARIQLNFFANGATGYGTTKTMAEAARALLQGYKGAMGSSTVGSVVLKNEVDLYESPQDGKGVGTFHLAVDYLVRYSESVPAL